MRHIAIIFGLAAMLTGCGTLSKALLVEKPADETHQTPYYTVNPTVQHSVGVAADFGPYGAAGSAIVLGALSAYAAWQSKKKSNSVAAELAEHVKEEKTK